MKEVQTAGFARQLEKDYRKMSRGSYWPGFLSSLVCGAIAGAAIGYSPGSPKTAVLPLQPGVEV
jgi:uncharacterized protein (DUF2062 family)